MRIPLSWLRDYVDVDASPEEIAERLVFSGTEVEAIERLGAPDVDGNRDLYRVGRVVDFVQHPNADRLRLCRVDVGEADPRQIVCGAANFAVGDTVAVVLPGARLPGSGERLKRAKLRGEVSDGMMLSERELQISDEHAGILTLPEEVGEPGMPLDELFALSETVLVLALTSNRGDCQSIHGVAREVATVFRAELRPLPDALPPATGDGEASETVAVRIDAPDRCARFTARVLQDVRVGDAPLRMRQRLAAAGMRPISNVVDITNYVMLASGQPLHAYDARRIRGGLLAVRRARADERLTTLDGRDRRLDPSMLVIADAEGPNGLAGIMGGELSEIAPDTSTLVLEAANFERTGILRTSQDLGLRSEASARFEKGVDPELAAPASAWATALLVEHAGARLVPGFLDARAVTADRQRLTLRPARVGEVLGVEVEASESVRILDALGFEPRQEAEEIHVRVPGQRRDDVTREIDLVEEVGRVVGFQTIPSRMPRLVGQGRLTPAQSLLRRTADQLAGLGLQEAVTTSFAPADAADRYGLAADDPRRAVLRPRNPLSAEYADLRTTIVPHLLRCWPPIRRAAAVTSRSSRSPARTAPFPAGSSPTSRRRSRSASADASAGRRGSARAHRPTSSSSAGSSTVSAAGSACPSPTRASSRRPRRTCTPVARPACSSPARWSASSESSTRGSRSASTSISVGSPSASSTSAACSTAPSR